MPLSFIVFFLIKYLPCIPSFPQQSLLPLSPHCQSPGRRSLISFLSPAPFALRYILPRFPFESLILSVEKKTERRRERHINLIKRVLLLAVGRHFLWQYRWQHCKCLCVVCVYVSPAEGSIRWPKPWFVNQSAVQGHSVLWGSAECRYTCVCVEYRCVLTLCFVSALKCRGQ